MAEEHKGEELKGRAKSAAGEMTGDEDMKREGKLDQASATAKEKIEAAKDKAKDFMNRDK